jgi:hypothetical protein
MALTISLPSDAESRLRERARAAGQDVTQYVEQLITNMPWSTSWRYQKRHFTLHIWSVLHYI